MKVNIPVRLKNPWFWVGVVSIIITALGVDPQQFVSWESLGGYIVDVLRNPVQLVTVVYWRSLSIRPPQESATARRRCAIPAPKRAIEKAAP